MSIEVRDVDEEEIDKEKAIDISDSDDPKDMARQIIKNTQGLELDEEELDKAFKEAKEEVEEE